MTGNTLATVAGGIIAATTAAQPVLNGIQGSLHQQDYIQLAIAVVIAFFGWISKVKVKSEEVQ